MKVLLIFLLLLGLAGGGYVWMQGAQVGGTALSTLVSPESQALLGLANSFMEDLKYKDYKNAAKYSLPEQQSKFDVPALIERMFQVKPEFLDIQNYEVTSTDLDSSGQRARVHLKSDIKVLNTNELRSPEVILYFKKHTDRWYMDLANSLQ